MENVIAGQTERSFIDEICIDNGSIINGLIDLSCKKSSKFNHLSSAVKYLKELSLTHLIINDELADKKVYELAKKLSEAIDKNSVIEIKRLKYEYGHTEEFAKAKEFLNKKCKKVWDVFENKHFKLKIPQQAMKALGITNRPSLEYLLADSLKYFEKDNGSTTVDIIKSVIENPNIDYSFDEIFDYLKTMHKTEKCQYNFVTVKYIADKLNYDRKALEQIGVDKKCLSKIFKTLSFKNKMKFIIKIFHI